MTTIASKYTLTKGDTFSISTDAADDLSSVAAYTDLSDLIKQVEWQQGARSDIEVTTFASDGPEFVPGSRAQDQITASGNWSESHIGAGKIRASYDDAELHAFKLEHEDGESVEWLGYVSQLSVTNPLQSVSSASITIKLTGTPVITAA